MQFRTHRPGPPIGLSQGAESTKPCQTTSPDKAFGILRASNTSSLLSPNIGSRVGAIPERSLWWKVETHQTIEPVWWTARHTVIPEVFDSLRLVRHRT